MKEEDFDDSITTEETGKMTSPVTQDGSTDRKGKPALKAKTGRWNSAVLLLGNYRYLLTHSCMLKHRRKKKISIMYFLYHIIKHYIKEALMI